MAKIPYRISVLACLLLAGGCANYHPMPLPRQAQLISGVDGIRHEIPRHEAGGHPIVIDVDKPLGPDQIGLLAILNDPDLESEHGKLALARSDVVQSAVLPNPSIGLSYAALLGGPGVAGAWAASIAQSISSLVTYRSRVAAARSHVSQVDAELLWNEWQVAQKARLLAVDLYWGERSLARSGMVLAFASRALDDARQAAADGNASAPTVAALAATQASLAQSTGTLRITQLKNWQALDTLLGMVPTARFQIARPTIADPPGDIQHLIATLPARRPDLVALQLGYRSADESVRGAILGQFPPIALGGSWASDTSRVRTAGPSVTFDLPIFNRNQDQIAKTTATRLLLYEQYQSRLDDTTAAALALAAQSRQLSTWLAAAQKEAVAAEHLAQAAQKAWRQNGIDVRSLIDYRTAALGRQLEALDLERNLDETRAALALELGTGLPRARLASSTASGQFRQTDTTK